MTGQGINNIFYGLITEEKAIKYFCTTYNVEVLKCGLVVHNVHPWLCASPDGLILTNGQITSVLEIKCPVHVKKNLL